MKSIQQLRAAGFTVSKATDAVGCTEVSFPVCFHYYNPQFHRNPLEVFDALSPAKPGLNGGYRLVIAGELPPDDGEIPFEVISQLVRDRLAQFTRRHAEVTAEAAQTCAQLEASIAQELGL